MVAWQQSLTLATAFLRLPSNLLVQRRRNKAAAAKLMRKLLKKRGFPPDVIITDKLRSYDAARLGFAEATAPASHTAGADIAGKFMMDNKVRPLSVTAFHPKAASRVGIGWRASDIGRSFPLASSDSSIDKNCQRAETQSDQPFCGGRQSQ